MIFDNDGKLVNYKNQIENVIFCNDKEMSPKEMLEKERKKEKIGWKKRKR